MADKYSQINRYLEIFSHLAKDAGWLDSAPPNERRDDWTIADMGAGKGYLTFGLWHLCRRVWKRPVTVLGVEARPDLVSQTNKIADGIGADGLKFIHGDADSVALPKLRALIALHACDTATDDAVRRGIDLDAELLVVAPCCHKQLRPELHHEGPLAPLLRHGLMEERMAEWVTDGLRALFLEWAGYRTKVIEFVASEHTPKNLMIAAVRHGARFADPEIRKQIQEIKAFFGIARHPLDPLLNSG
jgi:SAM-dependent methyltransferase